MILSHRDLRARVDNNNISFSPSLQEEQWGEASIDLRLGHQFTVFRDNLTSMSLSIDKGLKMVGEIGLWKSKTLKSSDELGHPERFKLEPGKFVLAETYEEVSVPVDLLARVEGRSTYARLGLSMHQTAPWIQPGWKGKIILEIMNNGPLTIELTPTVDRPCQLTFMTLSSPVSKDVAYGSKATDSYQNQKHPLLHGS